MNKKVKTLLIEKCKDFGLTEKAIDELSVLGSAGLSEEATEEDIMLKVDSLVPFAKAMQGEITRKTRTNKVQSQKSQSFNEGETEGREGQNEGQVPSWMEAYMKPIKESLAKLQNENATLKAETASRERKNLISSKSKELGIPESIMKYISISDDKDIETELTGIKQELINNNLMPKDAVHETGNLEEAFTADAKTWAESLPNK